MFACKDGLCSMQSITSLSKRAIQELIKGFITTVTQENHQRVNIFFDYAKKTKNTAWSYFLPMLNRQDLFTVHMVNLEMMSVEYGKKSEYRTYCNSRPSCTV